MPYNFKPLTENLFFTGRDFPELLHQKFLKNTKEQLQAHLRNIQLHRHLLHRHFTSYYLQNWPQTKNYWQNSSS